MPLTLSSLPAHIQQNILQKMDLNDFRSFEPSSQEAVHIAKRVKPLFNIPHKYVEHVIFSVDNGEVFIGFNTKMIFGLEDSRKLSDLSLMRFEADYVSMFRRHDLSEKVCKTLTNYCKKTGTTFAELALSPRREFCSPSAFHKLLRVANVRKFSINGPISPEYLRNLPNHIVEVAVNSKLEIADFVNLKLPSITVFGTNISAAGLNTFIKMWMAGKVNFKRFGMGTIQDLPIDEVFNEIDYLTTAQPSVFRLLDGFQPLTLSFPSTGFVEITPIRCNRFNAHG